LCVALASRPSAETESSGVYSPKSSIQPSWPSATASARRLPYASRPARALKSNCDTSKKRDVKYLYTYGAPAAFFVSAPAATAWSYAGWFDVQIIGLKYVVFA
jgi:hypothetical protein